MTVVCFVRFAWAQVRVNVTNVNEAPSILPAQVLTVPEDVVPPYTLGTVLVSDPDGDTVVVTSTVASPVFTIAPNGFVSTSGPLNFEAQAQYQLFVTATDPLGLTASSNVTVRVVDANDPPVLLVPVPTTPLGTFNVSEGAAAGFALLAVVRASDEDEDALVARGFTSRLQFSVVFAGGGPCANAFSIGASSGVVTLAVAGTLDFETSPTCVGSVTVADPSGATATQSLTIAVLDANEPPLFVSCTTPPALVSAASPCMTFSVTENAIPGATAFINVGAPLVAQDPDAGAVVTLALVAGASAPFLLSPTTGILTLTAPLDYEAQRLFVLQVGDVGRRKRIG